MLRLTPTQYGSPAPNSQSSLTFGCGDSSLKLELTPFFQGPPGSVAAFVFQQATPSAVWTIDHDMGVFPNVYVLDTAGNECEGAVTNPTVNRTVITFSAPFAGTARLI